MKWNLNCYLVGAFLFVACTSAPRQPAQEIVVPPAQQVSGPDIWELKKMAENNQFDELNDLFYNQGLMLTSLPSGYAAGAAGKVLGMKLPLLTLALDGLTSDSWRGKIFFPSTNAKTSQGLNRIQKLIREPKGMSEGASHDQLTYEKTIVPMASFVTRLLVPSDPTVHALVPNVKSNVVILNYAHPKTKKAYFQEKLLTKIQVYDVMVAVQGKYGPVFIGKTWLGRYNQKGDFHTDHPERQIAWFFLDFNERALSIQKTEHWDDAQEELLNPLPQMKHL